MVRVMHGDNMAEMAVLHVALPQLVFPHMSLVGLHCGD